MKELVLYIHGKGGNAEESSHYESLFPGCDVVGLDYRSSLPWEAAEEIREAVGSMKREYDGVSVIAVSIGAYFCLCAGIEGFVRRAYFISPVVDMESLILGMMSCSGVTEEELEEKGTVPGTAGEDLSWEYLSWIRRHPVHWTVPTDILYGGEDALVPRDTISVFAEEHGSRLTVMEDGGHWFHTDREMRFLDNWIRDSKNAEGN